MPFEKRMFLSKTFWKRNATLLTTPTSYVRACSYGGEALTDINLSYGTKKVETFSFKTSLHVTSYVITDKLIYTFDNPRAFQKMII